MLWFGYRANQHYVLINAFLLYEFYRPLLSGKHAPKKVVMVLKMRLDVNSTNQTLPWSCNFETHILK